MHPIAGQPMIAHLSRGAAAARPAATVVVIGPRMEAVARLVAPAESVVQDPPRGTGDAVRTARAGARRPPSAAGRRSTTSSCCSATRRCSRTETIVAAARGAAPQPRRRSLVAGMRPADPGAYGRLVLGARRRARAHRRGRRRRPRRAGDRARQWRHHGDRGAPRLATCSTRSATTTPKREFYLTDIVAIARRRGLACRVARIAGGGAARRQHPAPNWPRPRR